MRTSRSRTAASRPPPRASARSRSCSSRRASSPARTCAQRIDWLVSRTPADGARLVARAWVDPEFKERLLADARAAALELGLDPGPSPVVVALENTEDVHHMVVCTLCSCYPKALLGPPPDWYKSLPYRSRAVSDPRGVLREFGLELDDDVEVRVVDSTADIRYLVVPRRPAGTEALDEDELAALVTRDSMIGVAQPSRRLSAAPRLDGPEHDLDRGAAARCRPQAQLAVDRLAREAACSRRPGPRPTLVVVEADAVVRDGDDAPAGPLRDRHLDVTRSGVPARVAETLLDDPEHLDLLVRREPDLRIDVELDVELAVRREDLDVAAQRGVEPRRAARRREREHREPRFLLRRGRRALQAREDLLERRAGLEHAHLRRDREQVLRETVVDLARDARALVRDRPAELGLGDRPPHADEQDRRTRRTRRKSPWST